MCNSACVPGQMGGRMGDNGWRLREVREVMMANKDYTAVKIIDEMLAKVEEIAAKERLDMAYRTLEDIRKDLVVAELVSNNKDVI